MILQNNNTQIINVEDNLMYTSTIIVGHYMGVEYDFRLCLTEDNFQVCSILLDR